MKALLFLGIFFITIGLAKLIIYFILKKKEGKNYE